MKTLFTFFCGCICMFIFSGATSPAVNLKNYYFPYRNFFDETFYLFVNQKDTSDINCWSMQTGVVGKDTVLSTIIYDKNDRISESMNEKITASGSEMIAYEVLSNSNPTIPTYSECSIVENPVFKWQMAQAESFRWLVKYNIAGTNVDFSKTRIFEGVAPEAKEKSDEVMFNDKFSVTYYSLNKTPAAPVEYAQTSYYKLNKGLSRYTLTLPDKTVKDYLLKKVSKIKPSY